MKISEFVEKYKDEFDINYFTIHRLIKERVLRENIHYRKTYRGTYEKYTVLERPLVKFLKGEKL